MINWHSSDCRRPDVMFLDDIGAPSCLSCGEIGTIEEASFESARKPPETPQQAGFELRWPASLPFVEIIPDNHGSTEQRKPTSPAADEVFIATETPAATDVGKHTTAPAKKSLYEPLSAGKIRILELLPGKYGDPIHCKIRTVDLQFKPEYEALSYTWADANGDASLSQLLYVGDRFDILRITANCANALRRLRFLSLTRDLWVDAICIDQSNIQERSHQVGIMQSIYATASRVLIYLGEDSKDPGAETSKPWTFVNNGNTLDLSMIVSNSDYFTRSWVIQEVASARYAWVLYGSRGARWQDFMACPKYTHGSPHLKAIQESYKRLTRSHPWIQLVIPPQHRSLKELHQLLASTKACRATDPRDKVFALLGLFTGTQEAGLLPDYALTLDQVHVGVTAFILENNPELRWKIFAMASPVASKSMPCWAVNWETSDLVVGLKSRPMSASLESRPSLGATCFDLKFKVISSRRVQPKQLVDFMDTDQQLMSLQEILKEQEMTSFCYHRAGWLVAKGFSPFSLGDCSWGANTYGFPGVISGLQFPAIDSAGQEAPLRAPRWARRSDRLFAVAGLPSHMLILRPIPDSKKYWFVRICSPPSSEFSDQKTQISYQIPCLRSDHLVNCLGKDVILLASTWNLMLKNCDGISWLEPKIWATIREFCDNIESSWSDVISSSLAADTTLRAGGNFNGSISQLQLDLVSELLETIDGKDLTGFLQRTYKNILDESTGPDWFLANGIQHTSPNYFTHADNTFAVYACWNYGESEDKNTPNARDISWTSSYFLDPGIRNFWKALKGMPNDPIFDKELGSLDFVRILLGANLSTLDAQYQRLLRNNHLNKSSTEDFSAPKENGAILQALHVYLQATSSLYSTDPGSDASTTWATDFSEMWSVLEERAFSPEEYSIRRERGMLRSQLRSREISLRLRHDFHRTACALLLDLVRGTKQHLLPLESVFPNSLGLAQTRVTRGRHAANQLPPMFDWEDIYIC